MSQEVLYNIWKEGVLQEKRQALAGKFALTELDRQYIDTEDNIDAFAEIGRASCRERVLRLV